MSQDIQLKTVNISQALYELLRKRIINGDLEPGEQLAEARLSKQFNVSRTPLREALLKLEIEGLVDRMPNGRLFVHKLDLKEMKENFEVRIVVEALVARKSATLCTDKQIDDLEHLIDQVEEVINAEDEKSASIAIDLFQKFHSSLLDIADNRKCRKILNDLEAPPIKRYGHYSIISERRLKDSFFEHKEIFNFIADKNPEKAEAAMKEHIQNVGSTVLKQIQKLGNITSK